MEQTKIAIHGNNIHSALQQRGSKLLRGNCDSRKQKIVPRRKV